MPDRETVRVVMCAPCPLPRLYPGDTRGVCTNCGTAVQVPANLPPRRVVICTLCVLKHADSDVACSILSDTISQPCGPN